MTLSLVKQLVAAPPNREARALFRTLAVTGLASTILLIMIGSIVRVTGNGLGCPDWPLCHGRVIPPFALSPWVEFFHRLFGGAVVLQVLALVFLAWRHYPEERLMRRMAVAAGVVLALQVALGGIHVIYELPRWTGWIHTGVAMLIAGLLAAWLALTRPGLQDLGGRARPLLAGTRLPFWSAITAAGTYFLLLTGSLVTRTGASLVCPSFPYCGLNVVPANLKVIVTIQMIHRTTAFVVAFSIALVLWHLVRAGRQERGLRTFAGILAALLVLQFSLGMVNVWFALPMWSRVLHLGTGATIWSLMVLLAVTLAGPWPRVNVPRANVPRATC